MSLHENDWELHMRSYVVIVLSADLSAWRLQNAGTLSQLYPPLSQDVSSCIDVELLCSLTLSLADVAKHTKGVNY
jgi:hypothetical protein